MDFRSLILRAKEQGKVFLIAEKNGKDISIFFTEDNNKLPDFAGGLLFSIAKTISKSTDGKYTTSQALEAFLSHSMMIARTLSEKFDKEESGQSNEACEVVTRAKSSLN